MSTSYCPYCGRSMDEFGCPADPRTWLRRHAQDPQTAPPVPSQHAGRNESETAKEE